jgi:aminoacyl tRNA synthase complex-interacting multifunctional protein 1
VKASQDLFPTTTYTEGEKAELNQWLITASHLGAAVRQDVFVINCLSAY